MPPAWQRPGFMGRVRRFAEPRLLMTAAMAFFSIALTLNLTGVRLTDLRLVESAAECGALVHGAAADHGFDADHPLLRSSAAGVRSAIADAGTAPHDTGRRHGEPAATEQQHSRRRESQNRVRRTRMEVLAWTLRSSRASRRPKDSPDYLETSLSLRRPSRHPAPRIPAAPQEQDGKGAQYGLRKSQWCQCNSLLPELRQSRSARACVRKRPEGRFCANPAPWPGRICSSHLSRLPRAARTLWRPRYWA